MADIESSHLENLNGPPLAKKIPNGAAKTCNDYASIFGGLPISFSIPVLDPLPAINGCDSPIDVRSSGFDYSEIFGGFQGGGDFALSYEELLAESKRVSEETGSDKQVTEVSELPSEGPNGDHVPHSEKDETSNSQNSYFVSGKHNMPYHKSRQGSKVDTTNGPMHATKPPVFPVSTFVVEACPSSQNIKADNPPNMVTNDLSLSGDLKGEREEGKQGKLLIHTSYGCTEGFENDLKDDHKQFATEYAGPEDVKHHSRSSSYHSTSSGDISYPDSFVTVSDISLRTQPLRIPPPSRPPPELDLKQGDPKMKISPISEAYLDEVSFHKPKIKHQNYGGGVYKHQAIQETMKDNSPHFFDVESEASSAAAASAAAMKEAMEQAQARLKSAKESMERKRDNHQICNRLGHHDVVKCEERKEESQEVRNFSAEITQKTMEKDRPINDFFVEERQKTMKASKVALGCKEKATYLVSTEEAQQMVQGKESRLSQVSSKLEEKNDEWKVDGQFYELINKEKFKTVQEVPDHDNFEKKFSATIRTDEEKEKETKVPKLAHDLETVQELSEWEYSANQLNAASMADNIKENESKEAKMALEYKRNGKLYSVNESCEWNGNACKLISGIVAGREEEIKKILEAIPEFCVQEENENEQKGASVVSIPRQTENEQKGAPVVCVPKKNENKLEGALDFGQQDGNENKLKVNQETHVCAEEEKNSNAAKDAHVCRDEDKKLKASDEACKFEEVHGSEEKKQVAGKETLQCIQIGEELNATYVAFECKKNEKKLELVNEVGRLDANEREVNLFNGSREYELRENMKAAQEATQCEKLEKTRGTINLSCDHEVKNVCKLKGISVTLDQEESKNFNGTRKACDLMKDERKIKLTQEALELEENEMKLKASQEVLQVTVNRKKIKAEKEACQQNCNEKKAREAQLEHQQNENKLKASQVPCRLENSENKLTADEGEQGHREIDNIMEVQVCQGVKSRDFEAVLQAMLLEEEGNILSSSLDASESCIIRKKENTTANMHKEDERGNEERMEREKKQELEQARKLEEEKEREREREKDRLAVEKTSHEAHERAFAESWERAERIAVERVTAEARQRSLAEAQEKGEKAPVEAMGNSLAAKASREAKLRAERAAVERATAEARERAVERALAEKANLEARERVERSAATSKDRMRKDNEADGYFRPSDKEDSGMLRPSDVLNALHDAKFRAPCSDKSFEGTGGESALRCKARLERHQRTVERAAKALAEKKMRDILAQREQAERNRLAESLDADVRRWSNGKEGNLRALLSTLQYILGPESGWQPIPLTDVITAAAVKKAYRKATLSVHPDKLQQRGASIRHKYICEKVFDLLKDAWNRFNSEER